MAIGPVRTSNTRKGDLILVETVSRDSYSSAARREAKEAGRELVTERTEYTYGVVASATRDGAVKTYRAVGYGEELVSTYARPLSAGNRCWTMSAKEIDVMGVMGAAKAHHWDGHPNQPKPFSSLADAQAAARPFVVPVS